MALKVGNGKYKKKNNNDGTKKKFSWEILIGFAVYIIARLLLSYDIMSILSVILLLLSVAGWIFTFFRNDEEKSKFDERVRYISFIVFLFATLSLMIRADAFEFVEKEFLPFWEISLTAGLASAVLFAIKIPRMRKNGQTGVLILSAFLVALGITAATSSAICSLNYLLDENEPERIVAVIEGKDYTNHRKSNDTYELEFFLEGEKISIDVSRSVYRDSEIGDQFIFYRYDGAFDKAFYMAGDGMHSH